MKSFDDEKRVREKIISTIENLEQQATTISQNILSAKNPIHLLHQHKILAYTLMQPSNK